MWIHRKNTRTGFIESIINYDSRPPKGWHVGKNCRKCSRPKSAKAIQKEKVSEGDLLHFRIKI